MTNENEENKDSQQPADANNEKSIPGEIPSVSGELTDPATQERLQAVAKAAKAKTRKRIKAKTKTTVKVATAFGATNQEVVVEREIKATPTDEQADAIKAELDEQLEKGLPVPGAASVVVPEEKREEVKALRDKLAGMWSTDASTTDSNADRFISGVPTGNVVHNPDSGNSGVRMSFKSKPKK